MATRMAAFCMPSETQKLQKIAANVLATRVSRQIDRGLTGAGQSTWQASAAMSCERSKGHVGVNQVRRRLVPRISPMTGCGSSLGHGLSFASISSCEARSVMRTRRCADLLGKGSELAGCLREVTWRIWRIRSRRLWTAQAESLVSSRTACGAACAAQRSGPLVNCGREQVDHAWETTLRCSQPPRC